VSKADIYSLIAKQLQGTITGDEATILATWKSEKKSNQAKYNDIVDLWKKAETFIFSEPIDDAAGFKAVWDRSGKKRKVTFPFTLVTQIAAVLLLAVVLAGTYSYFYLHNGKGSKYPLLQEVSAAYGTRTSIDLPDGSTVILNSGSSIRFPNFTASDDERRVELTGEAYFEVAKNIKKPFVVSVDKLDVKVLGTTFNVSAYDVESEIKVALVEGRVAIADRRKPKDDIMELRPKEMAVFQAENNTLTKQENVNLEKHIGWIDGKIIFVEDPIGLVAKRLENWYNVEIVIENRRLQESLFTGTFINEPLEEILEALSMTSSMQYEIVAAEKGTDGRYLKRTVILK